MEGIMFKLSLEDWVEFHKGDCGNENISIKNIQNQMLF